MPHFHEATTFYATKLVFRIIALYHFIGFIIRAIFYRSFILEPYFLDRNCSFFVARIRYFLSNNIITAFLRCFERSYFAFMKSIPSSSGADCSVTASNGWMKSFPATCLYLFSLWATIGCQRFSFKVYSALLVFDMFL